MKPAFSHLFRRTSDQCEVQLIFERLILLKLSCAIDEALLAHANARLLLHCILHDWMICSESKARLVCRTFSLLFARWENHS